MSAAGDASLTWHRDLQDGLPVLTLGGTLTMAAGVVLHDAVVTARQRNHAAMLIDVSGLVVDDRDAVAVFARIIAEALRWPDVLVLVCAPTADVTPLLNADVLDPRIVYASLADGRTAALVKVSPVTEDLLPIPGAARQARDVVTEGCVRWDEPGLVGPAALVASELVTNATIHAHTMMTLQLRLRPCHLHIAVFDGSATHAVIRDPGLSNDGGRGLQLVDAVSTAWGSTSLPTGKVVWSALARPNRH